MSIALKDNPLELDFRALPPGEVRELRHELWSTSRELARHPRWPCSHPSVEDMAARFGVHPDTWLEWEASGVSGPWAALMRLYQSERRDVTPFIAGIDQLEQLCKLADGNWSELARWLDVERRTITRWRQLGLVPGRYGHGRIVQICYEDMVG